MDAVYERLHNLRLLLSLQQQLSVKQLPENRLEYSHSNAVVLLGRLAQKPATDINDAGNAGVRLGMLLVLLLLPLSLLLAMALSSPAGHPRQQYRHPSWKLLLNDKLQVALNREESSRCPMDEKVVNRRCDDSRGMNQGVQSLDNLPILLATKAVCSHRDEQKFRRRKRQASQPTSPSMSPDT